MKEKMQLLADIAHLEREKCSSRSDGSKLTREDIEPLIQCYIHKKAGDDERIRYLVEGSIRQQIQRMYKEHQLVIDR